MLQVCYLVSEGIACAGVVLSSCLVHPCEAGPLLLLSDAVIKEKSLPNAILSLSFWAGPALLLKFQIWETGKAEVK